MISVFHDELFHNQQSTVSTLEAKAILPGAKRHGNCSAKGNVRRGFPIKKGLSDIASESPGGAMERN
jgi:hypothetical protein